MEEINIPQEEWKQVKTHSIKYIKIAFLYFIIPLGLATCINEVIALLKILSWHNAEISFWKEKVLLSKLFFVVLIPLLYLYWFIHLALKNGMLQVHKDFFQYWNIDIAEMITEHMIEAKEQINIATIETYINEKLQQLPTLLERLARKIIDNIPYLEFVNAYNLKDLEANNKEQLTKDIALRMNELQVDAIESIVPIWMWLIIPINIIVIVVLILA